MSGLLSLMSQPGKNVSFTKPVGGDGVLKIRQDTSAIFLPPKSLKRSPVVIAIAPVHGLQPSPFLFFRSFFLNLVNMCQHQNIVLFSVWEEPELLCCLTRQACCRRGKGPEQGYFIVQRPAGHKHELGCLGNQKHAHHTKIGARKSKHAALHESVCLVAEGKSRS